MSCIICIVYFKHHYGSTSCREKLMSLTDHGVPRSILLVVFNRHSNNPLPLTIRASGIVVVDISM